MAKLAAITGKPDVAIQAVIVGQGELECGSEQSGDVVADESTHDDGGIDIQGSTSENTEETRFAPSKELQELADKWFAELGETGKLINNKIPMTRKDYLKHTKNLTREKLLEDPLLYVLFRSEEQGEVNFFSWLEKFPKAKDESK